LAEKTKGVGSMPNNFSIGNLLIDLAITVAFYCALPIIIARTKKQATTKKKYRWSCFLSNIVVWLVFVVLTGGNSSGGAYMLWTWVFSNVGLGILGKRNLLSDSTVTSSISKNEKTILIGENDEDTAALASKNFFKCSSCGAYYPILHTVCERCGAKNRISRITIKQTTKETVVIEDPVVPVSAHNNTPNASAIPTKVSSPHKQSFCHNCGEKLLNNSRFCHNCGAEVIFKS